MIRIAAILGLFAATPALARDPAPPPSGVVIHLFGQNSIMSNVLPTEPATPDGAAPASAPARASSNDAEPSAGYILHQMFVTGDPNDPPKPAPGRAAEHPAD
jgi:hypothetical protein